MADSAALVFSFGDFQLDEANATLRRANVVIPLPPKSLAVLCALVRQRDRLVPKHALLDAVWGHRFVTDSVLRSTISQLRAALGDEVKRQSMIQTVARRGYRFVSPPEQVQDSNVLASHAPGRIGRGVSSQVSEPTLVGRRLPLRQLLDSWEKASLGQRQLVWITGEAGIGKTSLIDAFASGLGEALVAHGQCVESFGSGEPYLPILDALGTLCREEPELVGLMRKFAPTWHAQMPWLSGPDQAAPEHGDRQSAHQDSMLREMGGLLDSYTQQRPLLLVIEDMHWSDTSTVRLVDYLSRRRGNARLMIVGTFRPAELVASDHPLKRVRHELRSQSMCQEIFLEPLSEQDVATFIAKSLPILATNEAFVAALHEHTEGLPLFLIDAFSDLAAQIPPDDFDRVDQWIARLRQGAVPGSLNAVIERQLDRLDELQRSILVAGSVAGMSFRESTLVDALQIDAASLSMSLEALANSGLWLDQNGLEQRNSGALDAVYAFRHALYRRAIYDRISTPQRAVLHQRVARSLENCVRQGGLASPAELAMHFEQGLDYASAARHFAGAAANALDRLAPAEASQFAEQGLALLARGLPANDKDHTSSEVSLLMSRGVAAAQLYGVASAEIMTILDRAGNIPEESRLGESLTWLLNGKGWAHFSRGEFEQASSAAKDMLDRAERAGDAILELCGSNLQGAASCYSGDMPQARRWLEDALASALRLGERLASVPSIVDLEVSVRVYLSQVLVMQGFSEDAAAMASAAVARAERIGHPMSLALAYRCLCMLRIRLKDPIQAKVASQALSEVVARHRIEQAEGSARWYRGWLIAHEGNVEAGYALIMEGYERKARSGMYAGCPMVYGYAAEALALRSDWTGAEKHVIHALDLAATISESFEEPHLTLLHARILIAQDNGKHARRLLAEVVDQARRLGQQRYVVEALIETCSLGGVAKADKHALRAALEGMPANFDDALRLRAAGISNPSFPGLA